MVNIIKELEIDDLYLLGAKARKRLHELLDQGDTKAIEITAVMDRSFQQRRLLEGQFTENHHILHATIAAIKALALRQKPQDDEIDTWLEEDQRKPF